MHERNSEAVVSEVRECFERYERALVEGDLETMTASFASDDDLVRFGIADEQRGPEQLAAWRASQPALPASRTLSNTVVSTFGGDVAVVTTHFRYPERNLLGRQSQTWLKRDGRWRIVHAHVSEIAS